MRAELALAVRPLLFVHIPKTGGTSLAHLLESACPPGLVSPARLVGDVEAITPDSPHRLFHGHFGPDLVRGFEPRHEPAMVTVVRDPVERVLSLYDFWHGLRQPFEGASDEDRRSNPLWSAVGVAVECDLAGFLAHQDRYLQAEIVNAQCRYLAGGPRSPGVPNHASVGVALAEQIAERFTWVGFTERLADGIPRLLDITGLEPAGPLPRLNVTPVRQAHDRISAEALARIRAANAADLALVERLAALASERGWLA